MKAVMVDADPQSRWINTFIASDLRGMEDQNRTALARLRSRREARDAEDAGAADGTPDTRDGVLPDEGTGGVPGDSGPDAGTGDGGAAVDPGTRVSPQRTE
jgi:hypothetical protein